MITGFGNNAVSALAENVTSLQTTLTVMPDQGSIFAALLTADLDNPSNTQNIYAKITLTNSGQTTSEICHLTAVKGDVLTVVRGQEGTTARGWSLNDVVANFATRGSENGFVQAEQLQTGQYTAAVAGGTENALAIQLPGTFFLNSATDWDFRTPIVITPTLTNTGASTLQVTVSGRVLGTFPLYKGNKTELQAGDIIADIPIACLLDKSKTFFSVVNPVTAYVGTVNSVNKKGPDSTGNVTLSANDVDAFPAEGGKVGSKGVITPGLHVNSNTLGAVGQGSHLLWNETAGRGEVDLVCNAGSGIGGFIFRTVNNDNTQEFGRVDITGTGSLDTSNTLNEMGQRVYSPNNPPSQLNGSGWFKDVATGFIIQWGIQSSSGNSSFGVTFPMVFPNACFITNVTRIGTTNAPTVAVNSVNQSGFVIKQSDGGDGGSYWMAIGY